MSSNPQPVTGRIIEEQVNGYFVDTGTSVVAVRLKGSLRGGKNRPVPGDIVECGPLPEAPDSLVITAVRPRKNLFHRPVLANADLMVVVTTLKEPAINLEIIDRSLFGAGVAEIPCIIAFNKTDLLGEEDKTEALRLAGRYRGIGYETFLVSARSGEGLDELAAFCTGKTAFFSGLSGVGKSSILNRLFPGRMLRTAELSRQVSRGVHTTTTTLLLKRDDATYIADTPGFTTIDLPYVAPDETAFYFPELRDRVGKCRFNDCRHENEPGCTVRTDVENAVIAEHRYRHYRLFLETMRTHRDKYGESRKYKGLSRLLMG